MIPACIIPVFRKRELFVAGLIPIVELIATVGLILAVVIISVVVIIPAAELLAQRDESPPQPAAQLLQGADIATLEQKLAATENNCPAIQAEAKEQLQRYYAQFSEKRRIAVERMNNPYGDRQRLDQNAVRLLSHLLSDRPATPYYLGESPYLFRLHLILARCEKQLGHRRQAISAYAMALRYAAIEPPTLEQQEQLQKLESDQQLQLESHPEQLTDGEDDSRPTEQDSRPVEQQAGKDRLNSIFSSQEQEKRHEERYLHIRRIFAAPERLAEESDGQLAEAGRRFGRELDSYLKTKEELKRAERQVDLALARRARGAVVDLQPLRQERERLQREKEELLQRLEQIRSVSYRRYHRQRTEVMSDAVYSMAKLVRTEEILSKRHRRRSVSSSYLLGRDNALTGEDRTVKNSGGYLIALELAQRIDPLNRLYMRLLAQEYHGDRKIAQAIRFTHLYIARSQQLEPSPKNLERLYRLLGQLYSDQRNHLLAMAAYEKAFSLTPQATPQTAEAALPLADLHFRYSGRWDRAERLYQIYLNGQGNLDLSDLDYRQRTERRGRLYRVYKNLAALSARRQRPTREKNYLLAARQEFMAIEQELLLYKRRLEQLQERSRELKSQLLKQRDEELERDYYELQRLKIAESKARFAFINSHIKALDLPRLLERLAWLYQQERRWSEALESWRQVAARGSTAQVDRAHRNIASLQLTLQDGRQRPPVLPADSER